MYALLVFSLSAILLAEGSHTNTQATNSKHYTANNTYAANPLLLIVNLAPANDSENRAADNEQNDSDKEPRYFHLTIAEWVQDGIAFALAVITAIYVRVTSKMVGKIDKQRRVMERQLSAMKRQLREMRTAREQTIEQMQNAGAQTADLIRQGAAQVAALNISANIANNNANATADIAKATRLAAESAQANTEMFINSERAWVIPELQSPVEQIGDKLYWRNTQKVALTTEDILAGKHLIYTIKLTNMGRTPAHIQEIRINYICLEEGVRELSPDTPIDTALPIEFIYWLDTRETKEIPVPNIDVQKFINRYGAEIDSLKRTALIAGWVKYRHMFSTDKTCYADFCYLYRVSKNRLESVGRQTRQREQIDPPELVLQD